MTTFSSRTIGTIQTLPRYISYGLMAVMIAISSTFGTLPAYAHNGEDHGDDAARQVAHGDPSIRTSDISGASCRTRAPATASIHG